MRAWLPLSWVLLAHLVGASVAQANGWAHNSIPFDALIKGLAAADATTRERSAQFLGLRGWPEAIASLVDLLRREQDPTVRSAIYVSLGRLGDDRGRAALTSCLVDEDRPELRADCVVALSQIEDVDTLDEVLDVFHRDPSILVRGRAVDALGRYRDTEAIDALASLLAPDANPALRRRAILALGAIGTEAAGQPLVAALIELGRGDQVGLIVDALARTKPSEAGPELLALLARTDDPLLAARTALALGAIRDGDALASLVSMLDDPIPVLRYYAVEALFQLGDERAAVPLGNLARRQVEKARLGLASGSDAQAPNIVVDLSILAQALRALVDLGPVEGAEAFIAAAQLPTPEPTSTTGVQLAQSVYECRRIALHGLGYSQSGEAADILVGPEGLGHGDGRLRAIAARSLAILEGAAAESLLLPYLADRSPDVRWTVALALGRVNGGHALPALVGALDDPVSRVRKEASLALGFIGDPDAQPGLARVAEGDPVDDVRDAAAYALTLLRDASLQ